jgi:predicted GNAT superfamily acetyltransferase
VIGSQIDGLGVAAHATPLDVVRGAALVAEQSALASRVEIRVLSEPSEMFDASALLAEVWGMQTEDSLVAPGMLVALAHAGNYVAGAYREGRMVAASIGFFHLPQARALHSHITGVLPEHVAEGIGRAIKFHQRAWCLSRGVTTMTWTYDPLVSRNAYFNLRKLGGRATEYLPDHYGSMEDGLNRGQPSDRMLVTWDLEDLHENRALAPTLPASFAVLRRGDGSPEVDLRIPDSATRVALELPEDIEALRVSDPQRAGEWRIALRTATLALFEGGWLIVDYDRSGHYVAERNAL